jgi:hypothetical protein
MTITYHQSERRPSLAVVGLAGPSGSGKSYSALRLARGLAGDEPFHVLDTENGKSEQLYGDMFGEWKCAELAAPFTPERYVEAIEAALTDGARVLVLDSISDEHDGDGGLLDIQEAYLQEKAGDNASRREALSFPAWKAAKLRHKRLVRMLRAPRCHLIVCMRAQDKIELIKDDRGKLKAVPKRTLIGVDGWEPICEKRLPYELLASFLMLPDRPGVPRPIKLPESYRSFISLDKQISEETGRALAKWAKVDNGAVPTGIAEHLVQEIVALKKQADPPDEWVVEKMIELGVEDPKVTLATLRRMSEEQAHGLMDALNAAVASKEEDVTF